jgi:hypothetical protein
VASLQTVAGTHQSSSPNQRSYQGIRLIGTSTELAKQKWWPKMALQMNSPIKMISLLISRKQPKKNEKFYLGYYKSIKHLELEPRSSRAYKTGA